jgi:ParB family chromosome partitioning protein
VAELYSLSAKTVSRYLRVHQLIPALKTRLDSGEFAFIAAVTLSFLKESEQQLVDTCVELNGFAVDMKKADALRQYSEKIKLDEENIYLILSGEVARTPKPNRTPTVKVSKSVYSKYFKSSQSVKEIQDIVEKALELYFEQTA